MILQLVTTVALCGTAPLRLSIHVTSTELKQHSTAQTALHSARRAAHTGTQHTAPSPFRSAISTSSSSTSAVIPSELASNSSTSSTRDSAPSPFTSPSTNRSDRYRASVSSERSHQRGPLDRHEPCLGCGHPGVNNNTEHHGTETDGTLILTLLVLPDSHPSSFQLCWRRLFYD
eukprot:TRINITY_DN6606_c0_g1_i6.p1 TRINITY_DN6606_c0_g1~~TRINITY_DN6606_c0_g1_i6.p1  ORF type:complete len:174 (-),score=26.53 TRINITY_DN6606_c0_g1_i6:181-702(-)